MDSPNKLQKYISTKVFITQPFFELQTPDFAWKFIWTVEPNDKVQKYKSTKIEKYKSTKQKSTKTKKNDKNIKSTQKSLDTANALVFLQY